MATLFGPCPEFLVISWTFLWCNNGPRATLLSNANLCGATDITQTSGAQKVTYCTCMGMYPFFSGCHEQMCASKSHSSMIGKLLSIHFIQGKQKRHQLWTLRCLTTLTPLQIAAKFARCVGFAAWKWKQIFGVANCP